jgi:hypothetical protein
VDARLFRQILFAAAVEARVRVQLLAPLAASPDHPVSIFHPEGEYLKGWLLHVVGPRTEDIKEKTAGLPSAVVKRATKRDQLKLSFGRKIREMTSVTWSPREFCTLSRPPL